MKITLPQTTGTPWAASRDGVPEWHVQNTIYSEETGKRVATVFETGATQAIAALPDLLAALADCLQSLSRLPDTPDAYRITCMGQARAALLKTGAVITE
jgi:hypothetical protein